LSALAALLSRAELAVGVDTGLTHLAAALGTPTIALFTETDPAGAGVAIVGSHARDLGGNGIVPTLADVQAAAGTLLRAAPRC
jgi:heptosyltransferase-1